MMILDREQESQAIQGDQRRAPGIERFLGLSEFVECKLVSLETSSRSFACRQDVEKAGTLELGIQNSVRKLF